MSEEDLLEAIKFAFQQALKPMNEKIDGLYEAISEFRAESNERFDKIEKNIKTVKSDIRKLKEANEITRSTTNSLVDWVDFYYREDQPFPLGIKQEEERTKRERGKLGT